uniref:DNA repair helicase rad5,16 n=1 Tax=Solanum tuberosum TaxID=4113 RepID=M1DQ21_SOLTU
MLKRTKKGRDADLGLPPRIVTLCKDCFDVKEEDYYRSLWDESRAQLNTYLGISCQLDGSMTITARDSAITRFTNDPNCIIFLMSLKAGGLSLNLIVASHVRISFPLFINEYSSFLVKYQWI